MLANFLPTILQQVDSNAPCSSILPRVHENQSVQLGWVAVTAKFRDYIILVM